MHMHERNWLNVVLPSRLPVECLLELFHAVHPTSHEPVHAQLSIFPKQNLGAGVHISSHLSLLLPTLLETDIFNSGISDFAANSVFGFWIRSIWSKSVQVLLSYLKPNISANLRPTLLWRATYISDFKHPQALFSFTSTHLLRS